MKAVLKEVYQRSKGLVRVAKVVTVQPKQLVIAPAGLFSEHVELLRLPPRNHR